MQKFERIELEGTVNTRDLGGIPAKPRGESFGSIACCASTGCRLQPSRTGRGW